MPSRDQVLLGSVPKSYSRSTGDNSTRNRPSDIDYDCYSLQHFIKLACEGRTAAFDMLHAPDSMILEKTGVWDRIISNRRRFYSRNIRSFIEYARRQTAKYGIKGSRLNAVSVFMNVLRSAGPEIRLADVWDLLPVNEHSREISASPEGIRQYSICGRTFQDRVKVRHVLPALEKFYETYGSRARLAAENREIDWKAVSHAFRAAWQMKEIFTKGTIEFPLECAGLLVRIKRGELDYPSELAPALEALIDEVEELSLKSDLPDTVDRAFWDRFICEVLDQELFGR